MFVIVRHGYRHFPATVASKQVTNRQMAGAGSASTTLQLPTPSGVRHSRAHAWPSAGASVCSGEPLIARPEWPRMSA
jgi:hypothetical protein